jgi:hypothetical protein
MDSKFLYFHEYEGLSLHLQNPHIGSYLRLFNAADTPTASVFLTSLLVVVSDFPKECISLRHLKQIPYVHQISLEMLRILLKNPL